LFNKDSIKIKDTASFQTSLGRKVKGGGGIIPDVFVSLDTLLTNSFLIKIMQQNLLREFALDYYKKNKKSLDVLKVKSNPLAFSLDQNSWIQFVNLVEKKKIEWPISKQRLETEYYITNLLQAYIAKLVWGDVGFYQILMKKDPFIISSLKHLNEAQKLLIASRKKTNS
jgi:carboxyl-terminal processing protease